MAPTTPLVSGCKALYGKRVHVVPKKRMWDSYTTVHSMAYGGSLRIDSSHKDLLEDLGNVGKDGEELLIPHYDVDRFEDGKRVKAQSHCDLAEALVRLGAVAGKLVKTVAAPYSGPALGSLPSPPDAMRSIFG